MSLPALSEDALYPISAGSYTPGFICMGLLYNLRGNLLSTEENACLAITASAKGGIWEQVLGG